MEPCDQDALIHLKDHAQCTSKKASLPQTSPKSFQNRDDNKTFHDVKECAAFPPSAFQNERSIPAKGVSSQIGS